MNRNTIIFIVLAIVFLVLNFTIDNTGTIFLILAVASALLAGYFAKKNRQP